MEKKSIILDGSCFKELSGFYDEVERKLTSNLDWKIGRNLDALDDILDGGFGMFDDNEPIQLVWSNSELSRKNLSYNETEKYLKQNLNECHPTNRSEVHEELEKVMNKESKTLFEIIVEIILEHDHIQLTLK